MSKLSDSLKLSDSYISKKHTAALDKIRMNSYIEVHDSIEIFFSEEQETKGPHEFTLRRTISIF